MTRLLLYHDKHRILSLNLLHPEEGSESERHDLHTDTELLLDVYAFVGDMGFGDVARAIDNGS